MILKNFDKISAALSSDAVMKKLIEKYGPLELEPEGETFSFLASAIAGQQLSGKVADVIWKRVLKLAGEITPEILLSLKDGDLRAAGLSFSKISYIKNLASAVIEGRVRIDKFEELPDEEIIKELTSVKGIGPWTAEMFLIFSLCREDVFSAGDGGLARAIDILYGKEHAKKERLKLSESWKPYRSYASLYLWKSLE
jgi:3-methyladenine DNA glycosylase/8-oxoguanine DNA glycosylase